MVMPATSGVTLLGTTFDEDGSLAKHKFPASQTVLQFGGNILGVVGMGCLNVMQSPTSI
jgi:hypothetical protein